MTRSRLTITAAVLGSLTLVLAVLTVLDWWLWQDAVRPLSCVLDPDHAARCLPDSRPAWLYGRVLTIITAATTIVALVLRYRAPPVARMRAQAT